MKKMKRIKNFLKFFFGSDFFKSLKMVDFFDDRKEKQLATFYLIFFPKL
jgi:hypothetical protein